METEEPQESEEPIESEEPEEPAESGEPDETEEPTESEKPATPAEPAGSAEHEKLDKDKPQTISSGEPIIDVVVPGSGQIIINPYHLPVGETGDTAQIVHRPQTLYNQGASPIRVDVSLVGTVSEGSEAVFVSTPPAESGKEIFLYAEFQNSPDGWAETYTGAPNQLVAAEDGISGGDILILDAYGEGYFRFAGAMSERTVWEETDTFGAVLVFTFSAAPEEAEAPESGASADADAEGPPPLD